MLVVDTSALLDALVAEEPAPGLVDRLSGDGDLHAPHLLDIEVLHALRALVRRGVLSRDRAEDARTDFGQLTIVRYPHLPLGERIWELGHNLSAYDAVFVALAEALGTPLVTCDQALAVAPGHHAEMEVFAAR
ncbi:MAG: type II toxin-antitoxin system VapC family toxin [Acidimicrobiales bacterium]